MGSGGVEGLSSRFYRLAKRAKSAFLWPESSLIVTRYDEAGNILRITTIDDLGVSEDVRDDAGWSAGERINTLNQIMRRDVGGDTWSYSWDDNGNLTGKTNGVDTWTYTWDTLDGRLTRVQGPGGIDVAYAYDYFGRMISRDDGVGVTSYVWDGDSMIRETTGMLTTTYCSPEGQLISFVRDGERYDCHFDALLSIRMVTNENGEVVLRRDFDAWGRELAGSFDNVPGGFAYGFVGAAGCRRDQLTGVVYMRARHYDSSLLRFLSRDPSGLDGGVNLYTYVDNAPLNEIDPTGKVGRVPFNPSPGPVNHKKPLPLPPKPTPTPLPKPNPEPPNCSCFWMCMWEVSVDFLLPFGVVSGCGAGLAYKLVARLTRIAAGVSWLLATAMFAAFAGRYCQEQCAIPHIREKYCPPPPDAVDDLGTDDMS